MIEVTSRGPGQTAQLSSTASHNDLFRPMYQSLLALHTASHVKSAVAALGERLQQASAGLKDISQQPVLAAMLQSTRSAYAHCSGEHTQVGMLPLHGC